MKSIKHFPIGNRHIFKKSKYFLSDNLRKIELKFNLNGGMCKDLATGSYTITKTNKK